MEEILSIASLAIAPVTGLLGWLVGKRKRNNILMQAMNQTFAHLTSTINLVTEANKSLHNELLGARKQIVEALSNQKSMKLELESLHKENAELKKQVQELSDELKNLRKNRTYEE